MKDRYDPDRMTCPKCGIEQPRAAECIHCHIVVDRYRPPPRYAWANTPRPLVTGGAIGAALLLAAGLGLVAWTLTRMPGPPGPHPVPVTTSAPDMTVPGPTSALDTYWGSGAIGFRSAVQSQIDLRVPMLVYFHRRECASCDQLQRELLNSPEFVAWVQDGLRVEVNVDTSPEDAELAAKFNVTEYPSLVAVRTDGTRIPIALLGPNGPVAPKDFVAACKKATGR